MAEGIKVGDFTNRSRILELVFPVGAIYQSFQPKSPAEWLGGTWEKIEGRMLLGSSNEYPVGSASGEPNTLLGVDNIPSHKHRVENVKWVGFDQWPFSTNNYYGINLSDVTNKGHATETVPSTLWTTVSEGGSKPHNNMPPYIAAYIWRRIA